MSHLDDDALLTFLQQDEAAVVHLARCTECRMQLEVLAEIRDALLADAPLAAVFRARTLEALRCARAKESRRERFQRWAGTVVTAALAAGAAGAVTAFAMAGSTPAPNPPALAVACGAFGVAAAWWAAPRRRDAASSP